MRDESVLFDRENNEQTENKSMQSIVHLVVPACLALSKQDKDCGITKRKTYKIETHLDEMNQILSVRRLENVIYCLHLHKHHVTTSRFATVLLVLLFSSLLLFSSSLLFFSSLFFSSSLLFFSSLFFSSLWSVPTRQRQQINTLNTKQSTTRLPATDSEAGDTESAAPTNKTVLLRNHSKTTTSHCTIVSFVLRPKRSVFLQFISFFFFYPIFDKQFCYFLCFLSLHCFFTDSFGSRMNSERSNQSNQSL
jgi:hypothetical protein